MNHPSPSTPGLRRLEEIGPDTPLRLAEAAARAFPDGSMTVSGLRREYGRGRLVIERVAGKDYTTLAAIERMRELCRLAQKAPASGFEKNAPAGMAAQDAPPGSSATADTTKARAALHTILSELKGRSGDTSPPNTPAPRQGSATVTLLRSR